jgi:mRNA interferase MazF
VNRGEVWWVERPEVGRRPHLIRTRDAAVPVLRSLLAVPASRTIRGIDTEVELGVEDGMPDRCALTLDNLRTIDKAFFVQPICTLVPARMTSVCRALGRATGCD